MDSVENLLDEVFGVGGLSRQVNRHELKPIFDRLAALAPAGVGEVVGMGESETMEDAVMLAETSLCQDDEGVWWVPAAAYNRAMTEVCNVEAKLYGFDKPTARPDSVSEAAECVEPRKWTDENDAADARRYRFIVTKGKVPIRCSAGFYYEDGVLYPTLRAAIDAAIEAARAPGGAGHD